MTQVSQSRRGGPLAMLGLVLAVWISGRAMMWESPFPITESFSKSVDAILTEAPSEPDLAPARAVRPVQLASTGFIAPAQIRAPAMGLTADELRGKEIFSDTLQIAAGHQMLLMAAMSQLPLPRAVEEVWARSGAPSLLMQDAPGAGWSLPKSGTDRDADTAKSDRWSLDAWAFWRQGSNSGLISQGRVPVYGASQAGAVLQYRVVPSSRHDPRAYVRAYRALVSNGESEAALGVSARPISAMPLRLHGEVRVTEGRFDTEVRGAAFATTEIPPLSLPVGAKAEVYAQGGYVGGDSSTAFVDGQLAVTREVAKFDLAKSQSARVSVGGGAWAGYQGAGQAADVHRVDLGPTARLDVRIGQVPARLSVDWRERVSGDAAPSSGVAATISTRF